jgi:hypothetical protein
MLSHILKERGLRQRRACLGSIPQMDGSHHDWFEGRGPKCALMVLIDAATHRTCASFYPAETTEAALRLAGRRGVDCGAPGSTAELP